MACLTAFSFSSFNTSSISTLFSQLHSLSKLELPLKSKTLLYNRFVRSNSTFNLSSSLLNSNSFLNPKYLEPFSSTVTKNRRFLSEGIRSSVFDPMATSTTFGRPSAEPIIIPAKGTHTATIVWLHGLGDSGNGWSDISSMLSLPNIKWILPTAPIRPVTVNGGFPCTAWFDIIGLSPGSSQDLNGLDLASEFVANIIEKEKEASGQNVKFAVGGFSMGGALSLYFLSKKVQGKFKNGKPFPDLPLNGVVCLSGWLPDSTDLLSFLSSGEKKVEIPILCCHGTGKCIDFMFMLIFTFVLFCFGFVLYVGFFVPVDIHDDNDDNDDFDLDVDFDFNNADFDAYMEEEEEKWQQP